MRFSQIFSSSQSPVLPTAAPSHPRAALVPRRPKPGEIYGMTVREARALSAGLTAHPVRPVDADALSESVEAVMTSLEESPSKLLVFVERSTADDYVPGHLANVCILCLATAKKMDWTGLYWFSVYSPGEPASGWKSIQTYSRATIFIYEILAIFYSEIKGWI